MNDNNELSEAQGNLEEISSPSNDLVINDTSTELSKLSDEQQRQVEEITTKIVPLDNESVIVYGVKAQDGLNNFSNKMLVKVQDTSVGDIGKELESLMLKLKMIDPEEIVKKPTVFQKLFRQVKARIEDVIKQHNTIANDVDAISGKLTHSKDSLVEDVRLLDDLYQKNYDYYEEINLYIIAGEQKIQSIKDNELRELEQVAEETKSPMDIQKMNDMLQFVNRLDKRLHDLKLSRQITVQTAPQIRMVQNVNQTLAEKIQSSVLTSIPLWKNQMAISLTLLRQEGAAKAQQAVTDTTNDLMLKNSQMLKQNTIQTAKENERGIIDVETLKTTQNNLVETIEETLKIQHEGTQKRKQAEKELVKLETDLKTRLIETQQKDRKQLN